MARKHCSIYYNLLQYFSIYQDFSRNPPECRAAVKVSARELCIVNECESVGQLMTCGSRTTQVSVGSLDSETNFSLVLKGREGETGKREAGVRACT